VVSEETGNISISVFGKLTKALDLDDMKKILEGLFKPAENKNMFKEFIDKNKKLFQFHGKEPAK
jgi:hypothetical protein